MEESFGDLKKNILESNIEAAETIFLNLDIKARAIIRLLEEGCFAQLSNVVSQFSSVGMRRSLEKTINDFSHLAKQGK